MSLYLNVSSLVWAACAALFVARYLDRWTMRAMALYESRWSLKALPERPSDPMPDDLLSYVNAIRTGESESDGIMREQTVSLLYERYAELGDWDKVRVWSAANLASDGWTS